MSDRSTEKMWTKSFITLTVSYFLLFLCLQMVLTPFPAYVKERFNPGDFAVSLVTGLFAVSAVVSRFVTAAWMRKVHRNALLFCGIAIAAVATAAYSLPGSFAAVLLLRIGFGVGFGMVSTIMPTLVSQIIPQRRIGEGIGYFGLSTSMAMSIGPIIGLTVLAEYGFAPLTALATAAAALIAPLLIATRSIPPQPAKPLTAAGSAQRKTSAGLILPALLNALLSVTYGGILSFLALFGQETGIAHVGLFFLFNVFTVLLVRPVSGRLFDSKGHAAVVLPGALFVIASLTMLSFTASTALLIVSALLYGVGFGALQPSIQAWMLRLSPPEHHGKANGLFYNSIDLGIAVGAMLLGLVASATGYAVMYRYAAGVMVLFLILYGSAQKYGRRGHVRSDHF